VKLVLANDANLWRIREHIFEAIAKPVGHVVAHHHDRSRRPRLLVFPLRFFRRRGTRAFALLLLRVLILPLARRTLGIVVVRSRIVLAAAEPIEKATRLRPGPLPV